MEHFFFFNSSGHLRSNAHQSQIIGWDANVDHTQTIGRDAVKLLGGIYPLIPPGFRRQEKKGNVTKRNYDQGWKSMLFKSKDESIVYTKRKD